MVEDLKKIEFHDLPVRSFTIDFWTKEIKIIVKDWDEKTNDYYEIQLVFSNAANFMIDKMEDIELDEITNCDLERGDNNYFIRFTFLYDKSGMPSVDMSFNFSDVKVIQNGISEGW